MKVEHLLFLGHSKFTINRSKNIMNNKIYIGQSADIEKRWNAHLLTINNPNKKSC